MHTVHVFRANQFSVHHFAKGTLAISFFDQIVKEDDAEAAILYVEGEFVNVWTAPLHLTGQR